MPNDSVSLVAILVRLPKPHLRKLNELVEQKRFPNVAEAIRFAIRDLLNYEFPTRDWILECLLQE